jgi:hypothetical protein
LGACNLRSRPNSQRDTNSSSVHIRRGL